MGIQSIIIGAHKPVFYAGESVTGVLTVIVSSPTNVGVINMKFQGIADVEWCESRTRTHTDSNGKQHTEHYTVTFCSHDKLITVHRDLIVQGGVLQPGSYTLPFVFETPYTLPSSFEGKHGSIRYFVKVKKPKTGFAALFPETYRSYVGILQPIDTNIPTYMFPVGAVDSKTICCLCCASGPLSVDAKTDRAAYCPGETVLISGSFENNSSREVRPYVRLIQSQTFYADGSRNWSSKTWDLQPLNASSIKRLLREKECDNWNGIAFQIPACYPSIKTSIIEVDYILEVAMDIPGAFDLRVKLPIVVATIPFRGQQVVTQQVSGYQAGWSGISGGGSSDGPITGPRAQIAPVEGNVNFEAPPPSYFESVIKGDSSIAANADQQKKGKKT